MSFDPFLTSDPTGSFPRTDFDGCLGFFLTTPSSPVLTVTELGRWKIAGNNQSHTVYLKLADGTVVASAVVDFTGGAGTNGAYNYTAITPVILTASTKYFILSSEVNGADEWYEVVSYTSSGIATFGGASYNPGCSGSPAEATAGSAYVPPNIKLGVPDVTEMMGYLKPNKLRPAMFTPGLAR